MSFVVKECSFLETLFATTAKTGSMFAGPTASCLSSCFTNKQIPSELQIYEVGTCESEIFVRIESRIESSTAIQIWIKSRIESECGFSWFLKQYCTIAPTVLASVYALATYYINHKHKINLNYNGAMVEVFCWTVSTVCGTTAGVADSKISNHPVTFESNRNRPIRIIIESRSYAGPYSLPSAN